MSTDDESVHIPSYTDLMFPTLEALASLGGHATKAEIDQRVIELLELTPDQLAVEYPEDAQQAGSKVVHRLAWARSYLRKLEAVEREGRGSWTLTAVGRRYLGRSDGEAEVRHREHELRVGKRPVLFLEQAELRTAGGSGWNMSVRELLSQWGVSRRGSAVVARVQRDLNESGLETSPSFASVPLDTEVRLHAVAGVCDESAADAGPAERESSTVTIGTLSSARGGVRAVAPDAPLIQAQSLMESSDFSQLAVATGERSLKGAISWESIARATLYGDTPEFVREAMDIRAVVVYDDEPLLEHVGTIADAGYVFVRDRTNALIGIVTSADLSGEFAKLANPFLLLGEIEGWLRRIVDDTFDPDDLAGYVNPDDPDRQIEAALSLTFGEYVRLFEDPEAWDQLRLAADRQVFCAHLDNVRRIRNSIMHFSPDPLEPTDLAKIDTLLRWVRTLARRP